MNNRERGSASPWLAGITLGALFGITSIALVVKAQNSVTDVAPATTAASAPASEPAVSSAGTSPSKADTAASAPATSTATPAAASAPAPKAKGNPLALTFKTPNSAHGMSMANTVCAGCHGPKGISTNPAVPTLSGQNADHLMAQLASYRIKIRHNPIMQQVAAQLSDQDIADVSAYFDKQPVGPAWKADPAARARGAALFNGGDAGRNLMACAICHGDDARGLSSHHVASLTNLPPTYLYDTIKGFHDTKSYGGAPVPETMRIAVQPLNDGDMKDLAAYISSIKQ